MTVELDAIREFLAGHEPFSRLPAEELDWLPTRMSMIYVRRGETLVREGDPNDFVFVIRSGAVDVIAEEVLLDRRDVGQSFGYSTIVGENSSRYTMIAVEDTLLLRLPRAAFEELAGRCPELTRYYSSASRRIRAAADELSQTGEEFLHVRLSEFARPALTLPPGATIAEAANAFGEHTAALVADGDAVLGIVTDRDFRSRVVARGLGSGEPVTAMMTPDPISLPADAIALEAMATMTRHGIHHLGVTAPGFLGIVDTHDLATLMRSNPLHFSAEVSAAGPEELVGAFDRASKITVQAVDRGVTAADAATLMTMMADALAQRWCELAEEELGPPPVPYAFAVLGSQGRGELLFASDQDNALILHDSFDRERDGAYFERFARIVIDGLAASGQRLCPGDMMATHWCLTVSEWAATFHEWITAPVPDALLHSQTFFDMRAVRGEASLVDAVLDPAVAAAATNRRMLAHLAALAVRREPPLGVFRGLVVDRSGEYANTLDLKKGGLHAVIQMARLFALSKGSRAVATRERLRQGDVSEKGANNLIDAFDYLQSLTCQHQALQIKAGATPDYHVAPADLTRMEADNMRDSFRLIKTMQTALATRYPVRST